MSDNRMIYFGNDISGISLGISGEKVTLGAKDKGVTEGWTDLQIKNKKLEIYGDISGNDASFKDIQFKGKLIQADGSEFIGGTTLDSTTDIVVKDISANDASFNSIFINNGSIYEKYTTSETTTTTNIAQADPNFSPNLTNITLDKKITAPDGENNSRFKTGQIDGSYGNGTAVSIYSNEILVGDCAYNSDKGRAYIFKKNDIWESTADVTFSPPTADAVDDLAFGWSVAISENYLAIAAPGPNSSTSDGKVYIYKKTNDVWSTTPYTTISMSSSDRDSNNVGAWCINVSMNSDNLMIGTQNRGAFL